MPSVLFAFPAHLLRRILGDGLLHLHHLGHFACSSHGAQAAAAAARRSLYAQRQYVFPCASGGIDFVCSTGEDFYEYEGEAPVVLRDIGDRGDDDGNDDGNDERCQWVADGGRLWIVDGNPHCGGGNFYARWSADCRTCDGTLCVAVRASHPAGIFLGLSTAPNFAQQEYRDGKGGLAGCYGLYGNITSRWPLGTKQHTRMIDVGYGKEDGPIEILLIMRPALRGADAHKNKTIHNHAVMDVFCVNANLEYCAQHKVRRRYSIEKEPVTHIRMRMFAGDQYVSDCADPDASLHPFFGVSGEDCADFDSPAEVFTMQILGKTETMALLDMFE